MSDSSFFPFQDVPGLLTPADQANVKSQTLLSAAAGLLNASGYTAVPHSMLADLGKGVSGGLQGYQEAQKGALTNEALRQQTLMRQMQMLQAANGIRAFGGQLPPGLLSQFAGSGSPNNTGSAGIPSQPSSPMPGLLSQIAGGAPNTGASVPSTTAPAGNMPAGSQAGGGGVPASGAPAANVSAAPVMPGSPVAAALAQLPPSIRSIAQAIGQSGDYGSAFKIMGDYAGKAAQPTDAEKNAINSNVLNFERQKAQATDDVTRFGKKYDAITQLGDQAAQAQSSIQLAKGLLNDPNFYSGAAEEQVLGYKKLNAAFGGDPNAAMPQEAFRGAIKQQILDTIRSLKGTGQIRVAEIRLIQQAIANPDHSVAGNRTLVEIADRLNNRALAVDQAARQYNGGSGHLDAGFDTVARKIEQQPVFSDAETKDPRLIAPPSYKTPQDMINAGLPKGTPFKTPDGGLGYAP